MLSYTTYYPCTIDIDIDMKINLHMDVHSIFSLKSKDTRPGSMLSPDTERVWPWLQGL